MVQKRARQAGLEIDVRLADLEKHEFNIRPDAFDFRWLLPAARSVLRHRRLCAARWDPDRHQLVDHSTGVKPMNPEFLVHRGELRGFFVGWTNLHDVEGKPAGAPHQRSVAEIVARRP